MEKQDTYKASPGARETAQRLENTLLHFHELAPWQQDNQHILTAYRPLSYSYRHSILSIPNLHNQTINIWTHLLGLLLFTYLAHHLWSALAPLYATATHEDVVVFACFFAGAFTCLSCSSAYHTFINHSEPIYERWLLLDFLGILCLIAGSWVPGVYYGFYCQKSDAKFYLTLVSEFSACSGNQRLRNAKDSSACGCVCYCLSFADLPYTRLEAVPYDDVFGARCGWVLPDGARGENVWSRAGACADGMGVLCAGVSFLRHWGCDLCGQGTGEVGSREI